MTLAKSTANVIQEIRRKTRRRFSGEEKIRIVLDCGESIATLCRREATIYERTPSIEDLGGPVAVERLVQGFDTEAGVERV